MMSSAKIDEMLDLLALDDSSHPIQEVSKTLDIPRNLCEDIARFLAKYGFVQLRGSELRISLKVKGFVVASSDEMPFPRALLSPTTTASLKKRG